MDSILVFGAGELQLSLIQNVKDAGYQAIVIDPDKNSPGIDIADEFETIAPDDYESTLEIAFKYNVKALVTAATDNPLIMMARVAEHLNLRFPSVESITTVLDKYRFKKLMQEHSIPCARGENYHVSDPFPDIDLSYPVIVKPNKNSGSRGVIKCESNKTLKEAIKQTKKYCRDGYYIIEEYVPGDEISVEALVFNEKLHIIQITDKIVSPPPYNVEYGHIQPSSFTNRKAEIQQILQNVIDATDLDNCALHPELKISDKGIFVIEVGPRLGGDFITSHLVPLSTDFNMEKALLDIATGSVPKVVLNSKYSMIQYLSLPRGTIVSKQVTQKYLQELFPELSLFRLYVKEGDFVAPITSSLNRHGFWILSGKDLESLQSISKQINSILLDCVGRSKTC